MSPGFLQPVIEARLVFPRGSFNSGAVGPHVVEAAAALLDHNAMLSTFKDVLTLDWVMRLGSLLSYDVGEATTFTVRGSSTFADWHVWRLHWLLESGTYDPVDVARAREAASKAAARDRASRRDTNARWRRAIREALFGRDHPYARDPGSAATIRVEDLEDFRDANYRANGATLIIVGQFDTASMTKTVTELFGAWSNDPPPPSRAVPPMQPLAGPIWLARRALRASAASAPPVIHDHPIEVARAGAYACTPGRAAIRRCSSSSCRSCGRRHTATSQSVAHTCSSCPLCSARQRRSSEGAARSTTRIRLLT